MTSRCGCASRVPAERRSRMRGTSPRPATSTCREDTRSFTWMSKAGLRRCPTAFAQLLRERLPTLAVVLAHGTEHVQDEGALGAAVGGVLDSARKHVALEWPQLVRNTVDDKRLHPAQDDSELLVLVAV